MEARKAASHHRAQMARKGLLALERNAQLKAQKEEISQSTSMKNCYRIILPGVTYEVQTRIF